MSVLYCTIPHFPAALARRDNPGLEDKPLVLLDPGGRVLGVSAEAATCGIRVGMTARTAEIRCPEARLLETDQDYCRAEAEVLFQLLEQASPTVEPHGWGAAYVELGDLTRDHADAVPSAGAGRPRSVSLCQEIGQQIRQELGSSLQPSLGWDSSKFTAQAAARRTPPGHVRAVDAARQRRFLQPLPVTLLPLAGATMQRLCFLGLRTLGQYAALPPAAVWQQFGRGGKMAHRCARGEDDRPVIPRWQAVELAASVDLEMPLVERAWLVTELDRLVAPLLAGLRGDLRACGQVRLVVHFEDGSAQEGERTFLFPESDPGRILRALSSLLDGMRWRVGAEGLKVILGQIQDIVVEQLTLFPLQDERETKLREVQRYLSTRFGANRLRRAVLTQPGAPLPEWRIGWLDEGRS